MTIHNTSAARPWTQGPRATFDLETTGPNPRTARIVTASLILVGPDGTVLRHGEWLADPGVPIPEEAAAVHGISTEYAQEHGAPLKQVVYELASAIGGLFSDGVPIFAFNAVYDFTVLDRELRRFELPELAPFPVLDPLVFNKKVDKYHKGKRTLTNLCEEYGVVLDNAHTSAADCLATERLATAMTQKYPKLDLPAGELHEHQISWAKEQAADLQAYFDKIGKQTTVNGDWPVQPERERHT
ncbi:MULTISPECIES: 3'-5' exonuclease [Kocuria]|uniref:3'-5' exonuclease n=1 Tax=Kocuria TaxID=57493 RepID=UPI0006611BDF|nr:MULTISPECIES: 3'-5' exonuclease [Kocuria]MCT1367519.1 3'-5' exonuclease [Rothia sp. p3-SID1597]RUQ22316.1 3'-5' exonuclease [Kocuria sp. HSID16901]